MVDSIVRTPEEYIDYYSNKLRADLGKSDLQINKLGLIGYILNILGWTHFDSSNYYHDLFKESFIGTAVQDSNLYMHSSHYGFVPDFATPATATGTFFFDFNTLPRKKSNVEKRRVTFSNINFTINNCKFQTDTIYRFIEDNGSFYGIILKPTGSIQYVPSSTSRIEMPFVDVTQIDTMATQFTVQNYEFGSFYPHRLYIDSSQYLADIQTEILKDGDTEWASFEIKNVKYTEGLGDIVFLTSLDLNTHLLEFGSGVQGNYVPNAKCKVTMNVSRGSSGNLNTNETILATYSTTGQKMLLGSTEWEDLSYGSAGALNAKFQYSKGGITPLTGVELRTKILEYIQTRENLIDKDDFHNLASDQINDYALMFRKSNVVDNIMYLCRSFRDKFMIPSYTLNWTQKIITGEEYIVNTDTIAVRTRAGQKIYTSDQVESGLIAKAIYHPDGQLQQGQYKYHICIGDNFNEQLASSELYIDVGSEYSIFGITCVNAVNLLPNQVATTAKYFKIYTKTMGFYVWYNISKDGIQYGSDPAVPGHIGIRINLLYTTSSDDVANLTKLFIESYQIRNSLELLNIAANNSQLTITNTEPGLITSPTDGDNAQATDFDITILGELNSNAVELIWNGAYVSAHYVVYGRPNGMDYRRAVVYDTTFTDIGDDLAFPIYQDSQSSRNIQASFFPIFDIFHQGFISPFVYVYNEKMDWYDGYVLYEDSLVNFQNIRMDENNTDSMMPSLHMNIVYDRNAYRTMIYIKSYQDIPQYDSINDKEGYVFKISIPNETINIYLEDMTYIDDTTWVYIINEDITNYGILWEPVNISIEVFLQDSVTNITRLCICDTGQFFQIYDVSDQLTLLKYMDSAGKQYVLNIPVIEQNVYDTDPSYYLKQIHQYVYDNDIKGRRMESDSIQFRFLNSYVIESKYLKHVVKQEYDFNLYLPLNIKVDIHLDTLYVANYDIDVTVELNIIIEELAKLLQNTYTGTEISYYNSQIVDFIHNDRPWIKTLYVNVIDNKETNPNDIPNGIESNSIKDVDNSILDDTNELISDRKVNILSYTQPFWHWNINSIADNVKVIY